MAALQANRTLSGSFAEVWVDGAEECYSISNVAFTELPFSFWPSDIQCLDRGPEAE